jgi:hypothetical protein
MPKNAKRPFNKVAMAQKAQLHWAKPVEFITRSMTKGCDYASRNNTNGPFGGSNPKA